ncbi:mannose-1-phosphate guanylyltransferase/mannose-6-phosphate isomerase, partial [Candidatus Gracilibacteria bacterium]|nr:mannose-1-phosphate guanylyltransferase/mannose-6-phosphate isomerase [Candidatus Gracilibacteria bacterium]
MSIYSIILAGGSGTRLWPLSRKYYPKQFIKFEELGNISLFQMALIRASKISKKENILIVTNSDYKFHCITQGDEIGLKLNESQILIEPIAKNTLPAITFAMQNIEENSFGLIMSSDHIIEQEENFVKAVKLSLDKAKESIITFGIKPFCPHTGYGYIEAKKGKTKPYKVNNFKEKPDLKTANKFIEAGYYWNAGIFMFGKEIFFEELEKNSPDVYKAFF